MPIPEVADNGNGPVSKRRAFGNTALNRCHARALPAKGIPL
jgi:hypothetical protein